MGSYSIRDMTLAKQIDRAESEMKAFKSRQYSGRRVLQTKLSYADSLVESDDVWGFPLGPPDPPTLQAVYQLITFQADTQKAPYGRLMFEIFEPDKVTRANGVGVMYYSFITPEVDDGKLSWIVDIRSTSTYGASTKKFYVEFFVAASDTGTITWSKV